MDFNDIQMWQWFALGGGVVLVLGVIVYFLPAGKLKIPAVITTAFGGLGAGLALGIVFMAGFGYKPMTPNEPGDGAEAKQSPDNPMAKGKAPGGGGPGAPKVKGGGPGGGGGGAPTSRQLLLNLVNALDTVVEKPVVVSLTADERAAILKELEGLDTGDDIKDEDAKAKLEAIQKLLEKDRKALETVGYRWATDGKVNFPKGGPPKDVPNPFKEGTGAERLKSLKERLAKK
jgi:hypothetical protein